MARSRHMIPLPGYIVQNFGTVPNQSAQILPVEPPVLRLIQDETLAARREWVSGIRPGR